MSIKLNMALAVAAASCMTVGLGAASASAGVTPSPSPSVSHTFTPPPRPVPQTCTTRPITFTPTVTPSDDGGSPIALTAWHGNTPSPSPSYTHNPTPPPVVNPLRCSPEQFVAQLTSVGNLVVQNRVIANGPVAGTGSLDLAAQTNTFDRARLPGLFRSVNIRHTGLPFPTVNLALCVASVNQLGVWRFAGGPVGSLFRNSIGNGTYLLTGQWVFPVIRNVCSLRLIRGNPLLQNRIMPRYSNIQVWATGLARR